MPLVKKIRSNLKLVLILLSLFFAKGVMSQTIDLPSSSSTGTFTITLSNIYSWAVQEKFGVNWTTIASGSSIDYTINGPITVTRPEGTYSYRLYNCYPMSGGCSYSATKTIVVDLPDPTPEVPTLTVPTTDADGTYSISWSVPQYADHFVLQERLNGGSWSSFSLYYATSRGFTGKGNGTWSYRVRACNFTNSCSGYSSIKSVLVAIAPGTPASITTPGTNDGDYTVSWGTASGSVTYYDFEYQKNSGSWTDAYSGSGTSKALSGLSAGTYTHRVRACKTVSTYTNCSAYRTSGNTVVVAPSSVPTISLPATDADGSYSISWGTVSNTNSYELQEQANGGSWITVQNTSATSKSYSKSNGIYAYRVRACNNIGCTGYSSTKTVEVAIAPGTPPSITTPGTNGGSYTISWGAASGAVTYYDLDYQRASEGWLNVVTNAATSWNLSGVTPGNYTHRVRACAVVGSYTNCSSFVTSGTTAVLGTAGQPTISLPSTDGDGQFTVSWAATAYANSYQLQEQVNGGNWTTIQDSSATSRAISKTSNTYSYRARACNAIGCSSYSAVKTIYVAVAPGIPGSINVTQSQSGSYTVNWSAATGSVTSYDMDFNVDNGAWTNAYDGSSTSTNRTVTVGGDYLHRVRACKTVATYTNCSGFLISTSVALVGPANFSYTYDALGRLIHTGKNGAMKTTYCYDDAGNRLQVSEGGTEGDPCAGYTSPPIPAPGSLSAHTHTGGGYTISWGVVPGATRYRLRISNGDIHTITDIYQTTFYTHNPGEAPVWIQACNASRCSAQAYF